jgi:hypothetical protein
MRTRLNKLFGLITVMALVFPVSVLAEPFYAQLVLQGVTFRVESPNVGSINVVTTRSENVTGLFGIEEAEADGTVTNVEVDDLNADGYPEVFIYVSSAGSGSYGSLIAYASNRNQSLSRIYLPPIEEDPATAVGYMGHDQFAVGEGSLLRRFPVYRSGDLNARPSGGIRQIQYKLQVGEEGWKLRPDRVLDY